MKQIASDFDFSLTDNVYDWSVLQSCPELNKQQRIMWKGLTVRYYLHESQTERAQNFQFKDFVHMHDLIKQFYEGESK